MMKTRLLHTNKGKKHRIPLLRSASIELPQHPEHCVDEVIRVNFHFVKIVFVLVDQALCLDSEGLEKLIPLEPLSHWDSTIIGAEKDDCWSFHLVHPSNRTLGRQSKQLFICEHSIELVVFAEPFSP